MKNIVSRERKPLDIVEKIKLIEEDRKNFGWKRCQIKEGEEIYGSENES